MCTLCGESPCTIKTMCKMVGDLIDEVGEENALRQVEEWFLKHYPENQAKIGAASLIALAKKESGHAML